MEEYWAVPHVDFLRRYSACVATAPGPAEKGRRPGKTEQQLRSRCERLVSRLCSSYQAGRLGPGDFMVESKHVLIKTENARCVAPPYAARQPSGDSAPADSTTPFAPIPAPGSGIFWSF
jgi:hypothetical protein